MLQDKMALPTNNEKETSMRKAATMIFLLFALAAAGASFAQTLAEAFAARNAKDHVTALKIFLSLAEKGDAKAQETLGWIYKNGDGTPKDDAQSLAWFRKAADQGNAPSQEQMGWMLREGRVIGKDDALAVEWFRKAADQNSAGAQFGLGLSYASGRGVPQDEQQAKIWYEKSAQRGYARAKVSLQELNDKYAAPGPDIPQACAAYYGGWAGKWSIDQGPIRLWVHSIKPDCSAKTSYMVRESLEMPPEFRTREISKDGTFSFACGDSGTCIFQAKGDELWGSYKNPFGGTNTIVLRKIK